MGAGVSRAAAAVLLGAAVLQCSLPQPALAAGSKGEVPREAASPDGKIRMSRDEFARVLATSYRRKAVQRQQDEHQGHELDTSDDEDDASEESLSGHDMPDLDRAWAEFSSQLRKGEIQTDEKGRVIFEVGSHLGREIGWWERHKTHIIGFNVALLWIMQWLRRAERSYSRREREKAEDAQIEEMAFQESSKKPSKKGKKKN